MHAANRTFPRFTLLRNIKCFFFDKHYLQRFSAEPNKKKIKGKGEKKEKVRKKSVFFSSVAATVTGGSLLNAGNCLVCVSVSDCHTTLFVIPL